MSIQKNYGTTSYSTSNTSMQAASLEVVDIINRSHNSKRILVYGFGVSGQNVCNKLAESKEITIVGILDRGITESKDLEYPLVRNFENTPDFDIILIALAPRHYTYVDYLIEKSFPNAEVIYMFENLNDLKEKDRWLTNPVQSQAALNFINYLKDRHKNKPQADNYPWFMYIEPSRNCNLRCVGCHSSTKNTFRDMSLPEFKSIIDEIGKYLYYLVLFRGGEAFMNKDFFPMLRYAYQHTNAQIHISSNMSFRFSRDEMLDLVRCCWLLDVCIDGLKPSTYNQYRVKGNFDLAFSNLLRLTKLVETTNAKCMIRWRYIVFKHNEHEVPEAQKIAEDLGITLQLIKPFAPDPSWLPSNEDLWRPQYQDNTNGDQNYKNRLHNASTRTCLWLNSGSVINHDLSVSPCCELVENFSQYSPNNFLVAYNSLKFIHSRENFSCKGCNKPGRIEWETALESHALEIISFIETNLANMDESVRKKVLKLNLIALNNR